MKTYEEKKELLNNIIKECRKPMVAYSGGVDSALVAKLAIMHHPLTAKLYSAVLPYLDEADIYFSLAAGMKDLKKPLFFNLNLGMIPEINANTKDRCYFCKKHMLSTFKGKGEMDDCRHFLEGSNADDMATYRPGRKAAEELGYRFPLAEAGFTKEDVRRYARELGLAAADRPSKPCLLTRFPYDLEGGVNGDRLLKIKNGEHILRSYLTENFRLRWIDDNSAEIEASEFDQQILRTGQKVIFNALPFEQVTIAKEPFSGGRFDRSEEKNA
ncbi:MAG: hypothetical protein IKV45_03640 [Firmicutes bacterium]|nr:hypothetical protein [Bacillota bacterium]